MDSSIVDPRKGKETEWMMKLRTVFPYGNNHDIGKNLETGDVVIGKLFPKLSNSTKRTGKHSRNNHRANNNFDIDNYMNFINDTLENELPNAVNKFRLSISTLRKSHLKSMALRVNDIPNSHKFSQWYKIVIDLIETKLYTPPPPKKKKKVPNFRLNLLLSNKSFDLINLPKILRTKSCLDLKPDGITEDDTPMVVFTLSEPIRSNIFNYTKFVSSLDINEAHRDIQSIPCHCNQFHPKFIDQHHKHILTGDLTLVENAKLHNLLKKGPKYREPAKINFDDALAKIKISLNKNYV